MEITYIVDTLAGEATLLSSTLFVSLVNLGLLQESTCSCRENSLLIELTTFLKGVGEQDGQLSKQSNNYLF